MLKLFRFKRWWSVIPPQVLGWLYFCLLYNKVNVLNYEYGLIYFFVALVSTAAFGYLFNDWCDIESDSLTNKKNSLAAFSKLQQFAIVFFFFIVSILSWYMINKSRWVDFLYILQIISLILYSAKPFRLKERAVAGILCDTFYGHLNPALITLALFLNHGIDCTYGIILLIIVIITATLKGVRNIMLHQIEDRKTDRKAGTNTFVIENGALFTLNIINKVLPFEAFFTFALVAFISLHLPPFFLSLLFFSILTYLKFSGWKLAYLPKRQIKFKFLYFLNDYYEGWMPFFFLLILCSHNPVFLFILILHFILFPTFIIKLRNEFKTIKKNITTEDDY